MLVSGLRVGGDRVEPDSGSRPFPELGRVGVKSRERTVDNDDDGACFRLQSTS